MIMYDAHGNMSVQIVHDASPLDAGSCRDRPTPYYTYFGTYDFNESDATIVHHVEWSTDPDSIGGNFKRSVSLDGDRLILTVKATAGPWTRILVWQRAK
jgi:hypothetical protein